MSTEMNILAIGAHPDDIEYGCGGTLLKHSMRGDSVYLMVMTEGTMGGQGHIRRREQLAAATMLGAKDLFWGEYEDTKISFDRPLIRKIEDVIDTVKPAVTLVHAPSDTHQDHRNLTQGTISATRYIKNVLFYEGPTTQEFTPTVFVDIHEVLDKKLALLEQHKSQVDKTNIEDLTIIDISKSNATFRGIQGRVKYAEGFQPLRLFIIE